MRWTRTIRLRFRSLLRRRRVEDELDAELQYHLDRLIESYIAAGMTRADARSRAHCEMGGIEQRKEECRDARGLRWADSLVQDLRYGCRGLKRHPGFAVIASLTLAFGIGANTAIFTLVNAVLIAPLPYRSPEQLVSITGAFPTGALAAMREEIRTMDVAGYAEGHEFTLTGQGEAVHLIGTRVSAELFAVLGVPPRLGRPFYGGEDRAGQDNVVILSHLLWQERFAADPDVIGRVVDVDGSARRIVGVMPADFHLGASSAQLWVPLAADPRNASTYWAGDFMPVVGRLRAGSSIEQARGEIRPFQVRVRKMFPWPMPDTWNADVSVVPLQTAAAADVRDRLLMLLAAVGLVLMIACANVANLLLSRATVRQREMAVRSALGAGTGRIARQLVTESLLLAAAGGWCGLLLAITAMTWLRATLAAQLPRLNDAHLDSRVLGFTAGLTIATGLLVGLAPAIQAAWSPPADSLRSGGRNAGAAPSRWLRRLLVVAEIGLAVLLVTAAGLLVRSFWALSHTDPGFRSDRLVTARLTPTPVLCAEAERCLAFYRRVLERIKDSAETAGAALVNTPPLGGRVNKRSFDIEGRTVPPGEVAPLFWLNVVTAGYFDVMRITLVAGRGFQPADQSGNPPVAIVSEATARKFWANGDALGQHLRFVGSDAWHTIVGVAADVRAYDLQRSVPAYMTGTVYVPYSPRATMEDGHLPAAMTLVVRPVSDRSSIEPAIRRLVSNVNANVAISDIRAMTAQVADAAADAAATARLFVVFAALALVLGMIGVYGVLSFLVSKRTHEIGIRIALGARPAAVLWLVLREGLELALAGIALGLTSAFVASRWLSSALYGVSPLDPATYAAVAATTTVAAVVASWIPTRRAARVDPLIALREG